MVSRIETNSLLLVPLLAAAALGCGRDGEQPPSPPEAPPSGAAAAALAPDTRAAANVPLLSREGEVFLLDGRPISPFGIRVANALQSDEIAGRLVASLDDIRAHGMESVALTIQGGRHTEGGNSAFNGFAPDGSLDPRIAHRLAWILDETAARGIVPVVTLFYRGRDQELEDADAVRAALVNTLEFLAPWPHAWVHVINEPSHPGFDHPLLATGEGRVELYRLAKRTDPDRIVSVGPESGANDGFLVDTWGRRPQLEPPADGDVSVEYSRGESYDTPGVFDAEYRERARADAEATVEGGGYWFWHAAWHQKADAEGWPRFDKGGSGTADDPGVSFIWDRMRELTHRRAFPSPPGRPIPRPPRPSRPARK